MIIQSELSPSSPPLKAQAFKAQALKAQTLQTIFLTLDDLHNPQIPSTDGLIKSIESILKTFKNFSDRKTKENVHIETILNQADKFNSLTRDSVQHIKELAGYARNFVDYMQIVTEEDVLGTEFIEVMNSQIQSATLNKSNIEKIKKGYSEILELLVNLVCDLEDYAKQTNIEQLLSEDIQRARKVQKTRTWAAVGTGFTTGAAIVAAPFTAGASLVIIGALGLTSAGAMIGTSVSSVKSKERANQLENELIQIDIIRDNIRVVMEDMIALIEQYNDFVEIFKTEIEEITKIIEKHSTYANDVTFRMKKIKYLSFRNQWTKMQDAFQYYGDEVQIALTMQ